MKLDLGKILLFGVALRDHLYDGAKLSDLPGLLHSTPAAIYDTFLGGSQVPNYCRVFYAS